MKYILLAIMFLALQVQAGEIYKCLGENGKTSFSDKPCPKDARQQRQHVTEQSRADVPTWEQLLDSQKPFNTLIIKTVKKDGDTAFTYQFQAMEDLQQFMRLAGKLSGKNVNLLNLKAPTVNAPGQALIQVSAKAGFPSPRKKNN